MFTGKAARDAYFLSWAATSRLMAEGMSLSGREPNSFFLNLGKGEFADASAATGFAFEDDARSIAVTDWNHDGRLDLWISNRNGPRLRLLQNNAPAVNQFLAIRLRGDGRYSNRDAIGARVELHLRSATGPQRLIRTLHAGEGFLSQSSKIIHFGVPRARSIEKLIVRWPAAGSEEFTGLTLSHHYEIRQGTGKAVPLPAITLAAMKEQPPEGPSSPATNDTRIVMGSRPLMPTIPYTDLAGKKMELSDTNQQPLLIHLWSTSCAPCLRELSEFAMGQEPIRKAGLQMLALNIDIDQQSPDRETQLQTMATVKAGTAYPFAVGLADQEALVQIDAIVQAFVMRKRPLALPTSLLLDASGRVAIIYRGAVALDQLISDATTIVGLPEAQLLSAAVPFAGRWLESPGRHNPLRVAFNLLESSHPKLGETYLQKVAAREPESPPELFLGLARIQRKAGANDRAIHSLQLALNRAPNYRAALIELGQHHLEARRYPAANEAFTRALVVDHNDVETLCLAALSNLGMRHFDRAAQRCREALAIAPDHPVARYNLGFSLQLTGDTRGAAIIYRGLIKDRPSELMAANNLAWIAATDPDPKMRNGTFAVALATRVAEARDREEPVFLNTLSAAFAESGDFKRAITIVRRAIAIAEKGRNPSYATTLRDRLALYEEGKPFRETPPAR